MDDAGGGGKKLKPHELCEASSTGQCRLRGEWHRRGRQFQSESLLPCAAAEIIVHGEHNIGCRSSTASCRSFSEDNRLA